MNYRKLSNRRLQQGFTLIEIILVIAIISILAAIVILAINPAKQLADGRNSQRRADVNTILNATYQYTVDNNGTVPSGITTTPTDICKTGAGSCTGLIDLSVLTTSGKYLVAVPTDPQYSGNDTSYQISKDANGRLTVSAPRAENGVTISVTR